MGFFHHHKKYGGQDGPEMKSVRTACPQKQILLNRLTCWVACASEGGERGIEKPIKAIFFAPFKSRLIVVEIVVSRLGQRTLWQTTAPKILFSLP